ncbi:uncharacterized protein B0T23DRAFT_210422 [Neurospora hispaniola]|uniref:Uncharacterized protein n=1 Tax=Neurospora hispaniola TaxID=588809 RepID=A0AAJ0I1X8_9PEZI|nr:hypothetical protein B0T23DRAFT_210422 [Neurospora hispaniola]
MRLSLGGLASGAERALAYKDPIHDSLGTAAVILVVSRTAEHPSALMAKRFYISLGHTIAVVCEIQIVSLFIVGLSCRYKPRWMPNSQRLLCRRCYWNNALTGSSNLVPPTNFVRAPRISPTDGSLALRWCNVCARYRSQLMYWMVWGSTWTLERMHT